MSPAHPAISLVRHRVRYASTSAALRSNAPAAMRRLRRSGNENDRPLTAARTAAWPHFFAFHSALPIAAPARACFVPVQRRAPAEESASLLVSSGLFRYTVFIMCSPNRIGEGSDNER